jgi:hypothetical protein
LRPRGQPFPSPLPSLAFLPIGSPHLLTSTSPFFPSLPLYPSEELHNMGLLALGTPLPWSDAKQHANYIREHGIEQFLHIYHRLKDRTGDRLLWGDEVRWTTWEQSGRVGGETSDCRRGGAARGGEVQRRWFEVALGRGQLGGVWKARRRAGSEDRALRGVFATQ